MATFSPSTTRIIFICVLILTMRVGIGVIATGRGAALFGLLAGVATIVSLAAVISFISPYYYELPTHHCPFCLLQKDYHYIGFPLYLFLLMAGTTGIGTGVIENLKGQKSLSAVIPPLQRRFCFFSLGGFLIFTVLASYPMVFSDFVLNSSPLQELLAIRTIAKPLFILHQIVWAASPLSRRENVQRPLGNPEMASEGRLGKGVWYIEPR